MIRKKLQCLTWLILFNTMLLCAQQPKISYEFQELKDISYLSADKIEIDSLQRLNLLIPQEAENPPLLIWIGGGAWSFVNRNNEMDLARQFARKGIAVASVGHRLSNGKFQAPDRKNGVIHPAHIEDIAAAFNYLYRNGERYGYNVNEIVVGGFSSGAHLAALLAMDEKYLAAYQLSPKNISAIIPVGGTYDIDHYYDQFKNNPDPQTRQLADTHVKDVFGGDVSKFAEASPVTYLKSFRTPMLLISDNALRIYTDEFERRLKQLEYKDYEVRHISSMNHGQLWRDLSFEPNSEIRRLIIDYILKLESS